MSRQRLLIPLVIALVLVGALGLARLIVGPSANQSDPSATADEIPSETSPLPTGGADSPTDLSSPDQAEAEPQHGDQPPAGTDAVQAQAEPPTLNEQPPDINTPASTPAPAPSISTGDFVAGPAPVPFIHAVDEDIDGLNPLLTLNPTTQQAARLLLPSLLGQNAQSGLVTPSGLAAEWTESSDGRTYTFRLRDEIAWSDGTPVTARDVLFTFNALANPTVNSPLRSRVAVIDSLSAPDDRTVVVTFRAPNCGALQALRQPLLPAHLFAADFSDLRTHPFNQQPSVTAGPFRFQEHVPGARLELVRDDAYWRGMPTPAGYHFEVVPDPAVRLAGLLDGTIDLGALPPALLTATETAGLPEFTYPDDSFTFLALNLADPAQPVGGRDTDDALLPQPPHPILGDQTVRSALAYGLDTNALVQSLWGNGGIALGSYILPQVSWAWAAELQPYAADMADAQALLAQAGWLDEDEDGVRTRQGVPLQLGLAVQADSDRLLQLADGIRSQLAPLGVAVTIQALPFEELTAQLLGQQFDLAVATWDNVGADPANLPFWHSRQDLPGAGFNFVSYQNAQVDGWLDQARWTPGCAVADRQEFYRLVQSRIYVDMPYIPIGATTTTYVAGRNWQGLEPGPWALVHDPQNWMWRE